MIPKGMILLTSSVLAVSIIRLSSKKVLVQEMYCIETLARVDVLCLDKTGTLTTDEMTVTGVIPFGADENKIKKALSSIVKASDELNATLYALRDYSVLFHRMSAVNSAIFRPKQNGRAVHLKTARAT